MSTRDGDHAPTPATAPSGPTRRRVLRGLGTMTVGSATVWLVSACGGGGGGEQEQAADPFAAPTPELKAEIARAVEGGQVAVGQAVFLDGGQVALTRPAATEYHVLSTTCTHQGGRIDRVGERGTLVCPLHGSEFDLATGAPKVGPAAQPLPARTVSVSGGTATLS